ncbi:MFS transporter [Nocardiopsis suaedae]|uniref:MFS transporter n=1 Tax=Nocardiopsis suaedae TaxID=3018444 RepID=A0ABT4TVX7_9ACTN|nr:MFS transporter [Nocardiopsis suaedae]MDA2808856.1 MFS transporter [Nocardiopsis suaedae]
MESQRRVDEEAPPGRAAVRARAAVFALFAVNGYAYTNVVPWLPVVKQDLELSNAALGAAIAAMPTGALATGMLAGPLIARFGSGRVAAAAGVLTAPLLPLAAAAPGWWAFALVLFGLGSLDAWMDAAMNTHGLRVQRRYGRSIINAFHAAWSLAAVAGGLTGASMAGAGLGMGTHLTVVAVLLAGASLVAARGLLPGPEGTERGEGEAEPAGEGGARERLRAAAGALRGAALPLLALSALLMGASAVEDSAATWGAVFLSGERGAGAFLAALPFVACQGMMTVGRLTGDRVTDRFGATTTVRAGGLVAAAGMAVALLVPYPAAGVAGFGLLGLGVATMFPLTLAAAGEVPGVRSGDGVTVVGWLGRLGFLAFPPMVGALADAWSLTAALWAVAGAGVMCAVLAPALRPRLGS